MKKRMLMILLASVLTFSSLGLTGCGNENNNSSDQEKEEKESDEKDNKEEDKKEDKEENKESDSNKDEAKEDDSQEVAEVNNPYAGMTVEEIFIEMGVYKELYRELNEVLAESDGGEAYCDIKDNTIDLIFYTYYISDPDVEYSELVNAMEEIGAAELIGQAEDIFALIKSYLPEEMKDENTLVLYVEVRGLYENEFYWSGSISEDEL